MNLVQLSTNSLVSEVNIECKQNPFRSLPNFNDEKVSQLQLTIDFNKNDDFAQLYVMQICSFSFLQINMGSTS